MKRPTRDEARQMCTRKRRYGSAAAALAAAALVGVERERQAYRCPVCSQWHLATRRGRHG